MNLSLRLQTALLTLLLTASARAQSFNDMAQQLDGNGAAIARIARAAPIRVQVAYQFQLPAAHNGTLDDQKAALGSSHDAIYDLAAHECEHLKVLSTGECRMASVSVNNMGPSYGAAIQVTGSATFELWPSPQPAGSPAK